MLGNIFQTLPHPPETNSFLTQQPRTWTFSSKKSCFPYHASTIHKFVCKNILSWIIWHWLKLRRNFLIVCFYSGHVDPLFLLHYAANIWNMSCINTIRDFECRRMASENQFRSFPSPPRPCKTVAFRENTTNCARFHDNGLFVFITDALMAMNGALQNEHYRIFETRTAGFFQSEYWISIIVIFIAWQSLIWSFLSFPILLLRSGSSFHAWHSFLISIFFPFSIRVIVESSSSMSF